MADEIESGADRTAEELKQLAITDPLKWVEAFKEENGFSDTSVEEFESGKSLAGLDMFLVSEEGGSEGGGEHAERTFAIAPDGSTVKAGRVEGALAYVEFYGYYSSYEGTDWDGGGSQVVEPVDVMVVQYHAKE